MRTLLALLGIPLLLTGCISYQAPSYTPMLDSLATLQNVSGVYQASLLSTAPNDDGAIMCRGAGAITVGEGKTYASYIVNSLDQDLKKASLYSAKAPTIQATYTKIDFQSNLGASNWYISGVYKIGKDSVSVDTVYNDRSSFAGGVACNNMSLYFPKAVAMHLNQLYKTALFKTTTDKRANTSLPVKLEELKGALDSGLISATEYETKRQAIIAEF